MARIAPEDHETALAMPDVRQFDMTGRPMKGWIVVGGDALTEEERLAYWIERSLEYASSLPPK